MAIHMLQLRCPNCDAFMEVEDNLELCYCKYCGTRILLDGQSEAVVKAKTRLKMADRISDTAVKLQSKRYEQKRIKMEYEAEEDRRSNKLIIFFFVLALLFFVGMGLLFHFEIKSEKETASNEQIRLETLLNEILQDIEKGEYDLALIKSSGLRYSVGPYSNEYEAQWEETRRTIVSMIEKERALATDNTDTGT